MTTTEISVVSLARTLHRVHQQILGQKGNANTASGMWLPSATSRHLKLAPQRVAFLNSAVFNPLDPLTLCLA